MTALEQLLLRSYLDGDMNPEEVDGFELLMLERPDIAEMVDADSALRFGLSAASSEDIARRASQDGLSVAPAIEPSEPAAPAYPADKGRVVEFPRRQAWPVWASAACVLVALGFGAGIVLRDAPESLAAAELVYVDKSRSISAIPKVSISPARAVVLLVPVANSEPCIAEIEIRQPGAKALRARSEPDEFGYASLILAKGSLVSGRADVLVHCGKNKVAEYPVEIELDTPGP